MFENAATLALICAIIIGVRKGAQKDGIHGLIDFALLFGIVFALIVGLFAVFEYVT